MTNNDNKTNGKRLTQAIVRRYVRLLGGSCGRTGFGAELRIRLAGAEYFTESLDDAIGTARYMATHTGKLAAKLAEAETDLTEQLRQDVLIPEKVYLPMTGFVDYSEDDELVHGDDDDEELSWTEVQA